MSEIEITEEVILNTFKHYRNSPKLGEFIGRALYRLNQEGAFQPLDSQDGRLGAMYYNKYKRLEDWQIKKWVDISKLDSPAYSFSVGMRLAKYASKLNEIAKKHAKTKPTATGNLIFGKTFVITGTLTGGTRAEASDIIIKAGGNVQKKVTKTTDYLIASDKEYNAKNDVTEKMHDARILGTTIITENDFRVMLKESGYIWFS